MAAGIGFGFPHQEGRSVMAKQFVHAMTKEIYALRSDGLVQVTNPETGETGTFTSDGQYVDGDLDFAEMVMCQFVGRSYPADSPLAG